MDEVIFRILLIFRSNFLRLFKNPINSGNVLKRFHPKKFVLTHDRFKSETKAFLNLNPNLIKEGYNFERVIEGFKSWRDG